MGTAATIAPTEFNRNAAKDHWEAKEKVYTDASSDLEQKMTEEIKKKKEFGQQMRQGIATLKATVTKTQPASASPPSATSTAEETKENALHAAEWAWRNVGFAGTGEESLMNGWLGDATHWFALASQDKQKVLQSVRIGSLLSVDLSPSRSEDCAEKWVDTPCNLKELVAACSLDRMADDKRGNDLYCHLKDQDECKITFSAESPQLRLFKEEKCGNGVGSFGELIQTPNLISQLTYISDNPYTVVNQP